jgi:nitroreductase
VVAEGPEQVVPLAEAACVRPPYGMNRFARDCSAIVAIVTEKMKLAARIGAQIRGVPYSLVDIGIAGEHLVLQAAEDGLGSCWIGWFDERAAKRILGIPRAKKVELLITLGYAADDAVRSKNRKPIDEIRRYG